MPKVKNNREPELYTEYTTKNNEIVYVKNYDKEKQIVYYTHNDNQYWKKLHRFKVLLATWEFTS